MDAERKIDQTSYLRQVYFMCFWWVWEEDVRHATGSRSWNANGVSVPVSHQISNVTGQSAESRFLCGCKTRNQRQTHNICVFVLWSASIQPPVKTIFIAGACFDFVEYRTRAYQSANWIRSETTVAADISKMPCKPFRAPFSTPCLRLYCIPAGRPAERACAVVNDRTL